MSDLLKLLDGSIEDLKAGLPGKSHDDLLKLKQAETDGKSRRGALDALEAAIADADAKRSGGLVQMEPGATGTGDEAARGVEADTLTRSGTGGMGIAADLDTSSPANLARADEFDTAGAPQQIVPDVDLNHPAVDSDPRAGTTDHMNRIDFNDPVKPGQQVVEEALRASSDA